MKFYVFVAIFLLALVSMQEVRLKIGESGKSKPEGLEVEFHSVAEDSRCPKGVTCMWAGNAKVLLKVKKNGAKPVDVELNTNSNPRTASYLEYELTLKELRPYPESDVTIKPSDYEVILTMRKR